MTPTKAVVGQTIRASSRRPPEVRRRPDPPPRSGAPAPDARITERRSDVARDARRRRLAIAGTVAVVAALVASALVALHSPLFAARAITVTGAVHESEASILTAGGLADRPPLIDVSVAAAEARIAALPWVASVEVERHWPDGLSIVVAERAAVGVVALPGGRHALLDRFGRVLTDVSKAPKGLLRVTGVGVVPAPGRSLDLYGQQVMKLASGLPGSLRKFVVAAGAGRGGELAFTLRHGGKVLFGSTSELGAKFVAFETLITDVRTTTLAAKVVDVRVPESPVLTP